MYVRVLLLRGSGEVEQMVGLRKQAKYGLCLTMHWASPVLPLISCIFPFLFYMLI